MFGSNLIKHNLVINKLFLNFSLNNDFFIYFFDSKFLFRFYNKLKVNKKLVDNFSFNNRFLNFKNNSIDKVFLKLNVLKKNILIIYIYILFYFIFILNLFLYKINLLVYKLNKC